MSGALVLPPLFPLAGFDGTVTDYIDALYAEYLRIVGEHGARVWGKPVVPCGYGAAIDGRHRRFWHLVTEVGPIEPSGRRRRQLSLGRCAVFPRVRWLLERLDDGDEGVTWWSEGRRRHLQVAPADFSMHVVLEERGQRIKLITAYSVNNEDRRRRLRERHAAWWATSRRQTCSSCA